VARKALAQAVLQIGMTITSSYEVTHFIPNRTWMGISYALFRYALYTAFYTSAIMYTTSVVTQYTYDVAPF